MKNKSLIMLVCILFHTLYISSMDTAQATAETQVAADAQTKSDVPSTEVSVQEKSQEERHWNALTIGDWDVPGGKIGAALAGAVLTVGGVLVGGKAALDTLKPSELEWPARFRNLLAEVSLVFTGFDIIWADFALWDGCDEATDAEAADLRAKAPHDLLRLNIFMGKLNDHQKREFLNLLELLEQDLWDNNLLTIIRDDQKDLLQVKKREDLFEALTSEQEADVEKLEQRLTRFKLLREDYMGEWIDL